MENKNFTVYKSSAGSGKTFTLVKEYLKLALSDKSNPPQKYRHILAITFTNKAAAEMKERIVNMLKEVSQKDSSKISAGAKTMLGQITEETKIPVHEISAKAENVLHAILHNYSDFAIGTIDAFIHKIIRTFAHDLQIPLNFEIEMDNDKLLEEIIDLLVSRIGTDEKLTKALVDFTENKTDDEKSWHIENDLKNFARNLLEEDGIFHLGKLKELSLDDFEEIRKAIIIQQKNFETEVLKHAVKGNELIKKNNLTHNSFFQTRNGISAWFEKLTSERFDVITPNSYVTKTIYENKWAAGKATESDINSIEEIKDELTDLFLQIQNIKEKKYADYVLFGLIYRNIYPLAVLNEIEKLLTEHKKENNILHISEFNRIISKIVMSQPVPFIYERLGEKYNHYLLDEFQDTSVLQWHNLLPLLDNALAENNFNMLVGDGKQAIYRWRGGEVEQFAKLPELLNKRDNVILHEREQSLKNHFSEKTLSGNYRSKAEVVDFNNKFFRFVADSFDDDFKSIYKSVEQEYDEKNNGGFVSVEFVEKDETDFDEKISARTIEHIRSLEKENYSLGDISILVRSNSEGSFLANELSANGIKVVSSESLLLKFSDEINFILSFLKYINEPSDPVSRAAILQYLISTKKLPVKEFSQLSTFANESSNSEFREYLKKNNFLLHTYFLAKLPLYELCEETIRIFKLNESGNSYLQFFLDEVAQYTIKKNNNLSEFLEWWNERKEKASLVISEGMNAVNIMTIHKSKGLEFPVVIMPYANWKKDKGAKNMWVDLNKPEIKKLKSAIVPVTEQMSKTEFADLYAQEKNKALLDNFNVLYVGMTRAIERLYVITTPPSAQKDLSKIFIDFLKQNELWSDDKSVYEFGNKKAYAGGKNKKGNYHILEKINSNDWREKIKIRINSADIWETDEIKEKKERGILLHYALSKIKTSADVDSAIQKMISEGLIKQEESNALLSKIKSLISKPEISDFFSESAEIKTETDIIQPNGNTLRPDRVLVKNKNVSVIDFKTGKKSEKHAQQLSEYADLLLIMGYEKVESYLIYTEDEHIERVD